MQLLVGRMFGGHPAGSFCPDQKKNLYPDSAKNPLSDKAFFRKVGAFKEVILFPLEFFIHNRVLYLRCYHRLKLILNSKPFLIIEVIV